MAAPHSPVEKGSLAFFGAWLLLHEKADDWIRDALRRARETPDDVRDEYQRFLLEVETEKEALKGLLGEGMRNELRRLGFVDRETAAGLTAELEDLRARLRGLEQKLERLQEGSDP